MAASGHLPKRLLLPAHDQFTTVEALSAVTADWRNTTVTVLPGVDHFIAAGAEDACRDALSGLLAEIA